MHAIAVSPRPLYVKVQSLHADRLQLFPEEYRRTVDFLCISFDSRTPRRLFAAARSVVSAITTNRELHVFESACVHLQQKYVELEYNNDESYTCIGFNHIAS